MLLSPAAYLERALESDRLAAAAVKPQLKMQHSNWAAYYRFMAGQKLDLTVQAISDTASDAHAL